MLSYLEVKNYKSLADFKIDLCKLNVLIGANNSGKSNVLDCLAFLCDTTRMGVDEAYRKRGGFDHLVFGGKSSGEFAIKIILSDRYEKKEYGVAFDNRGVFRERLTIEKDERKEEIISGSEGRGHFFDDKEKKMKDYDYGKDSTTLFTLRDFSRHRTIINFKQRIEKWRFYNFVPFEMRGTFPPTRTFDLGEKGDQMARTLHSMLSAYRGSFTEIEETLKSAIREMEELQSPLTVDGKTYIAIKEKHFERPFDFYQVSDGTLRFLAHLLVLFLPNSEIPSLACFEEPENFVHPRLLQLLADILRKAKTQIIITTHSPYFVDFVDPEDLIVIEKKEGRTLPKRPDRKEIDEFLKEFSLGELWYTGKIGGVP